MALKEFLYTDSSFPADKQQQFRGLFDQLYKSLCIYVFGFTGSRQASEEIVVDAFTSLWENYHTIRDTATMRSWLYQVSRNKSINWLKSHQLKQKKEAGYLAHQNTSVDDITANIIHAEAVAELHKLIYRLPAQCSRIFSKIYIEGKNLKETAEDLQVSINTVKSQKNRGLQILRQILRPALILVHSLFI